MRRTQKETMAQKGTQKGGKMYALKFLRDEQGQDIVKLGVAR